MRRREFLGLVAGGALAGSIGNVAFAAGREESRNLLVLVEMKGGNDALNTVIPYADPLYARLRPRIALARDQVLKLDERAALHPSLEKLLPAWVGKELAIVEGVGYPDPNLSHFRSIEIWDTASKSAEYLDDGWLARAFARSPSPATFAADGVVVGSPEMGPLLGAGRAIALANPEQFLRNARLARDAGESGNVSLAHILRVEREILRSADKLTAGQAFVTEFPAGPFGSAIRTAAQLAANPAGIAVIRISLGGFDTHAGQLGAHANLMRQLGEGLSALRAALKEINRWQSTVVATYSEFGRRPQENQSGGTDHGTASAHFVMGGRVRGGLHGAAPQLARLESGNLPFAVDFRSYYATLMEKWWGMDSRGPLGGTFPKLDILV